MFDPTLGPKEPQTLALQTRRGGEIVNSMNPAELYDGVSLKIDSLRTKHPNALHRNVGPSAMYNCHGLTFAARRTGISDPKQVMKIIRDDGYTEIPSTERIMAGDIAIYREQGDITHSGVVMSVKGDIPWILGKWGDCHEVIHAVHDCPYTNATVTYLRLMK